VVSRVEFWEMLASLRQSGLSILVSTPYMDEAARCDSISLMSNGRILETCTPPDNLEEYFIELIKKNG
jgi:ABC-type multidrug transport system ATPase subunit